MEKKQQYDDMPEVAPQNFPEVTQQNPYAPTPTSGASPRTGLSPIDGSTIYSGQSPYQQYAQAGPVPARAEEKAQKTICGCPLIVFVLTCIVAVLSAAVIGLAAGTGVEANRASGCQSRYDLLNTSLATGTASSPAATSTSYNSLTNGCTDNPDKVTKTIYKSFKYLGAETFVMYCNRDTPHNPLMGLFVADFNGCMDACASWSRYVPDTMNSSSVNSTCQAVSYIPLWNDREAALKGTAPGNCYLKAGPQNETGLLVKNIGTEVHAAIVQSEQ